MQITTVEIDAVTVDDPTSTADAAADVKAGTDKNSGNINFHAVSTEDEEVVTMDGPTRAEAAATKKYVKAAKAVTLQGGKKKQMNAGIIGGMAIGSATSICDSTPLPRTRGQRQEEGAYDNSHVLSMKIP